MPDKEESTPTEYEITRIYDMSDENKTAVEECSTTERIGRRLRNWPILSTIIGSLCVGIIMWAASNHFSMLMGDAQQPLIDDKQDIYIKSNQKAIEHLTTHVKEKVADINLTVDSIETEQMEQKIMLIQIKNAIENIKQ